MMNAKDVFNSYNDVEKDVYTSVKRFTGADYRDVKPVNLYKGEK